MSSALDDATLETLDRSTEIEMVTPRSDGSLSRRPIWVVVADGEAYVRSYLGPRGAWYRRALADRRVAIGVDGHTIEVGVEPEHGEALNQRVSDAFRAKYGARSSATQTMVGPEVSGTTLRLTREVGS